MIKNLLTLCLVFLGFHGNADTYEFWDYNGNGEWTDNGNWDHYDGSFTHLGNTSPGTSLGAGDEIDILANADMDMSGQTIQINGTLTLNGGNITNSGGNNLRINSGGIIQYNSNSTITTSRLFVFTGGSGDGQLTVPNGSIFNTTSTSSNVFRGDLIINGNLNVSGSVSSTSTFDMTIGSLGNVDVNSIFTNNGTVVNSGDLNIGGNFTNNSSFTSTASSSTITFDGSSLQTVAAITAYRVVINNSNGVSLNGDMTISSSGNLTFTSGDLTTSSNKVTLGTGATISGETSSRYVVGELQAAENVVSSSTYDFGGSGVTLAVSGGSTNAGIVTMNRHTGNETTGNENSGLSRYVSFDATNSAYTTAEITMSYFDDELSDDIAPESSMKGFRTPSSNDEIDGTAPWTGVTETVNATSNILSISGLTPSTFDEFSFSGGDDQQVLPISLAQFEANQNNANVTLDWATATEENNQGFYIHRSYDGITYEEVDFVEGAGNSINLLTYQYDDRSANFNASDYIYYRLKQVDFDGTWNYTPIRTVFVGDSKNQKALWFPNPAQDYIHVNVSTGTSVELMDLSGRTILNETNFSGSQMDLSNLSKGTYILRFTNAAGVVESQEKLVKN